MAEKDTMDQRTGDSTQGQSTAPVTEDIVVTLELPWSMKEEPQDQPSAVYSTVQPMSDNTSGSLLSLNTSHVCQRCSATFVLFSSLEAHMETFHGETLHSELPVASRLHDSASENTDQMPSGQERSSTQRKEDSRKDSVTSAGGFAIKLESPWSMKEEPQDQPSAVYSTVQPMSDNTSGSLLSLNTSHVCQRCSATFVLFSSLELHMVTFHGETLHDWFPMHSTSEWYDVDYHHASKIENVGNCDKKIAVKRGKEKREGKDIDRTDQKKKSRKLVCDVCSKVFTRPDILRRHKLIHTGHKPFVCDVCSKAFTQSGSLKAHKLVHSDRTPYVCEMCGKGFTKSSSLQTHRLSHTSYKSFVCDVCNKAYSTVRYLERHKLVHTGDKPFVCYLCNEAFAEDDELKEHKLIHTTRKLFVCEICSQGFTQSTKLKRHKLIHIGQKPFVCDVCSKAFIQAGNLKAHRLIHTGDKPFVCDMCGKAFNRSTSLKRHRKVHTEERTPGV